MLIIEHGMSLIRLSKYHSTDSCATPSFDIRPFTHHRHHRPVGPRDWSHHRLVGPRHHRLHGWSTQG